MRTLWQQAGLGRQEQTRVDKVGGIKRIFTQNTDVEIRTNEGHSENDDTRENGVNTDGRLSGSTRWIDGPTDLHFYT